MIWVRWAIPDLSGSLRDRIRREAYITNEIIIKQEAERARKSINGMNPFHLNIYVLSSYVIVLFFFRLDQRSRESMGPMADLLRIEQLMATNLSSSQLDLVMHGGDDDPFAPGHVKPRNYDSKLHQNNSKYSEMFLETEKNGGVARKNRSQNDSNHIDIKVTDEPATETSSL